MHQGVGLAIVALVLALSAGHAHAQSWNAIAIDMAGGYDLVAGARSEEAARQQALEACGKDDCEVVMATEALCLSVADTPEGNYQYGWAYGSTREGAEHIALGYCHESGYPGCKTLVAQCVVTGEPTPAPTSSKPLPKTKSKG